MSRCGPSRSRARSSRASTPLSRTWSAIRMPPICRSPSKGPTLFGFKSTPWSTAQRWLPTICRRPSARARSWGRALIPRTPATRNKKRASRLFSETSSATRWTTPTTFCTRTRSALAFWSSLRRSVRT
eukprot:Amastigsp_a847870_3.p4 type:complete len:128 gc:universal Amastigsp_a847870_3:607-224(-)